MLTGMTGTVDFIVSHGFEKVCPAGRAPYAGRDHFVICIPLRLALPLVPRSRSLCDHREARAKPVYAPRSGSSTRSGLVWQDMSF